MEGEGLVQTLELGQQEQLAECWLCPQGELCVCFVCLESWTCAVKYWEIWPMWENTDCLPFSGKHCMTICLFFELKEQSKIYFGFLYHVPV